MHVGDFFRLGSVREKATGRRDKYDYQRMQYNGTLMYVHSGLRLDVRGLGRAVVLRVKKGPWYSDCWPPDAETGPNS